MVTRKEIQNWVEKATNEHSHVVILRDTFDPEYFPVYVKKSEDVRNVIRNHESMPELSQVMEVYNLALPLADQLAEPRAINF